MTGGQKKALDQMKLSLYWRRVASYPSRHARVRRCPASPDRLAAEPRRGRQATTRSSARLQLGWRPLRATCTILLGSCGRRISRSCPSSREVPSRAAWPCSAPSAHVECSPTSQQHASSPARPAQATWEALEKDWARPAPVARCCNHYDSAAV